MAIFPFFALNWPLEYSVHALTFCRAVSATSTIVCLTQHSMFHGIWKTSLSYDISFSSEFFLALQQNNRPLCPILGTERTLSRFAGDTELSGAVYILEGP